MYPPRTILRELCLVVAAIGLGTVAPRAHAQEPFVHVSAEPSHRVRLATPRYRVYEVLVEPGKATLFHEHKADNFAVLLSQSDVTNEIQGGQRTDSSVKPGVVTFAAASPTKPYVHRILARGGAPFWNLTIELLHSQASNDAADSPERIDPVLTTVLDSPRGKALRLNLAPSQTATLPSRVSDILVVCLSDGSVVQQLPGRPSERWTCTPGTFRLLEQPREAQLTNPASTRVDLIVLALQ